MLIMEALFILTVVTTVYTSPICSIYCDILFRELEDIQWQSHCKCFLDAHDDVTNNLHQKHSLYNLLLQSFLLKNKPESRHYLASRENNKAMANVKIDYQKNIDLGIENNGKRYARDLENFDKSLKQHTEANSSEKGIKHVNSNEEKSSDYISFHALLLATVNGKFKLPKDWREKWITSKQTNTSELNKNNEINYHLDTDKYGIKNVRMMTALGSKTEHYRNNNGHNDSSIYDENMENITPPETVTRKHTDIETIITPDELLPYKNYDKTESVVPKENVTKIELINNLINTTDEKKMSFYNLKNKTGNAIGKFNESQKYIENRGNNTSSLVKNIKSDKTITKVDLPIDWTLQNTSKNSTLNSNNSIEALQSKNLNRTKYFGKTINNTLQMQFNNVLNTSDMSSTTKNYDAYDLHIDYPEIINITVKSGSNPINEKNNPLKTNNFNEETTTKRYIKETSFKSPNFTDTINNNEDQNINKSTDIFQNAVSPYKNKTTKFNNHDEVITVSANDNNINSNEVNINLTITSSTILDSPKKNNSVRAHYQESEIPIIRIFSHEFPNDTVISVINGTEILPNKDFVRYETNMRESIESKTTKENDNFNNLAATTEENINNNIVKNKLLPFNKSVIGRLYYITGHQAIPALFVQKPNGDLHLGLDISNVCKKTNCAK